MAVILDLFLTLFSLLTRSDHVISLLFLASHSRLARAFSPKSTSLLPLLLNTSSALCFST